MRIKGIGSGSRSFADAGYSLAAPAADSRQNVKCTREEGWHAVKVPGRQGVDAGAVLKVQRHCSAEPLVRAALRAMQEKSLGRIVLSRQKYASFSGIQGLRKRCTS
jgi:hypothetical protein